MNYLTDRLGRKAFSLVELMVVILLFLVVVGGSFMVLSTGRSAWITADASIQLEENLRQGLNKMGRELSESGLDKNSILQVTISDNTGTNNSDVIKFSIPVVCQANATVIDVNGDVAYWRAPLTYGCITSGCMDADNDCNTVDYKYLQYEINSSNQLIRQVLNSVNGLVRQDVVARNINNLQATLSADQKVVTLALTGQITSGLGRVVATSKTLDVKLRNRR